MVTETLSDKIQRIRQRLADITQERQAAPADDFARRSELLDEEHTLQARLAELQDEAAANGAGLAKEEAGDSSRHERVPEIPENR